MRAALGGFRRLPVVLALSGVLPATLVGCVGEAPTTEPRGVDEITGTTAPPSEPLDPKDFVEGIDNPWLPLAPGRTWTYRSESSDGPQRITVTVLKETKQIQGVTATVVHDVVTGAKGKVIEDTYDWYAQDTEGNVWYLGEDTTEYDGTSASTEGSWEAGVDGARAGIAMLAKPRVGDGYKQEYLEGVAEDQARVIDLDSSTSVPAGEFAKLVMTEDTTPLEPDLVERKLYARGVGVVSEVTVEGGDEIVSLLSYSR